EAKVNSTIMDGILSGYDALSELLVIIEENKNENFDTELEIVSLEKIIQNIESGAIINETDVEIEEENEVEKDPYEMNDEELEKAFLNNSKKINEGNNSNISNAIAEVAPIEENENNDEIIVNLNSNEHKLQSKEDEKNSTKIINKISSTFASKTKDDKKQNNTLAEQTIRVEVERLDELLNLVSELVLGRNRLTQLNSDVSVQYEGSEISRNLGDTARQIDLLTKNYNLL
ncbi:MAG: hypothetical protein KDC67_14505, partial [Ignavibacteriae bacterium]|nr:hypothetical protein [Ignavibacteriota bacterium]